MPVAAGFGWTSRGLWPSCLTGNTIAFLGSKTWRCRLECWLGAMRGGTELDYARVLDPGSRIFGSEDVISKIFKGLAVGAGVCGASCAVSILLYQHLRRRQHNLKVQAVTEFLGKQSCGFGLSMSVDDSLIYCAACSRGRCQGGNLGHRMGREGVGWTGPPLFCNNQHRPGSCLNSCCTACL